MDLDDLFVDLEKRFSTLLVQESAIVNAQALELQFGRGAPREWGAGGQRILLLSPQLGADFVAGIDPQDGSWWAFRMEALKAFRLVAAQASQLSDRAGLVRTAGTMAELAMDWFTPMRLRLFLRGEPSAVDANVTAVASTFLTTGIGAQAIQLPLQNLIAVRAKLNELTCA
jgi:hypothetical protein